MHGRPEPLPPVPVAPAARTPRVKVPPRVPGTRAKAPEPVRAPVKRKWTPPDELRPAIVAVLQEAGGELDGEDIFAKLEERVGEQLRPGDREPNPQGELRWRAAARKARKTLMDEGLMETATGVWKLSDLGKRAVTPEA